MAGRDSSVLSAWDSTEPSEEWHPAGDEGGAHMLSCGHGALRPPVN